MGDLSKTNAIGVYQSDIIIQSAIAESLADLRRNPWLLDFVFAGMTQDTLTNKVYGVKQIQLAKEWFLKTQVDVVMNMHANTAQYPTISIALLTSEEVENTLGDVDYNVKEDYLDNYPPLTQPFTPVSYDRSTGATIIPDLGIVLASGMVLFSNTGKSWVIQEVDDNTHLTLDKNITDPLNGVVIKGAFPAYSISLEGCNFKEVYSLGCHVIDDGKGTQLMWLYSILKFCLLRYRQVYMEARGFERTTINWQPPKFEMDGADSAQRILSRYCIITGYTREVWVKALSPKVTATAASYLISQTGGDTAVLTEEIDLDQYDSFGKIT